MKKILSITALSLLLAGSATAQSGNGHAPGTTIQCLDVAGQEIPPLCDVPASRLDKSEYICTCPAGGQRVDVPICAKGETRPPENVALYRVRRLAMRDGTLVGDTFQGKAMCLEPRRTY
jgi:hypothetical protein